MTRYYVRTNEGAYLQGHANPTPLWTNKVSDAEKLEYGEAVYFADKIKNTLRKNVSIHLEQTTNEPMTEEEFDQEHLLNLLLGKGEDDTITKMYDTNVDDINHPSHYNQYTFEAIDIIDEVAPTYPVEIIAEMANVIKYALRAPHKGQLKKDLGKIVWYTQRAIDNLEKSEKYDYED